MSGRRRPWLAALLSLVVPEDCYFLVGDNRRASKDSRHFGAVPRALIHGSVDYRFRASDGLSRLGPVE